MKIAIYALCSADGVIQYVGQTNDFEQRKLAHFSASGRFYRSRYKMRVLRWSVPHASDRIEIQVIRALKKRGQVRLQPSYKSSGWQCSTRSGNANITQEDR